MRNQTRTIYLLWCDKTSYNLGELYEAAVERFEKIAALEDESIAKQFLNILESNTPLDAIFGEFAGLSEYTKKGRSVQGLKEGDFRTSTGDWVQAKRKNQTVISLTQIYNYLNRVIDILSKLTKLENYNNDNTLKNNVVQQFINAYYSDKTIDKKIKDRIKNLPLLNEIQL